MKVKTTTVTLGGKPVIVHVAAVPGINNSTQMKGFLAYGFKVNRPAPTTSEDGFLLVDYLYETEDIALREGLKIAKAQLRHDYSEAKKEFAKRNKKSKK